MRRAAAAASPGADKESVSCKARAHRRAARTCSDEKRGAEAAEGGVERCRRSSEQMRASSDGVAAGGVADIGAGDGEMHAAELVSGKAGQGG